MARAADDDESFEDIRIAPPPTAHAVSTSSSSSALDDLLPLSSVSNDDDDGDPRSSSSSSSSSPSPSSGPLLRDLLLAWQDELHAPDVLPYPAHLIASVLTLLNSRQSSLEDVSSSSSLASSTPPAWLGVLYELELDRWRWVLVDYHRVRLLKVQRYAVFVQQSEQRMQLLSHAERDWLQGYTDLWGGVMRAEYTSRLVGVRGGLKELDGKDMVDGWGQGVRRGEHVLLRALSDVGVVDLSEEGDADEAPIEVYKGDVYIARYTHTLQRLLHAHRIQLL